MHRAKPFNTLRVASLFQIAATGLLSLIGPARAADQPFDVNVTADSTSVMTGEKPIGEVKKGTKLTVLQTNGDWYLIDLPDAKPPQQGWIRKSDVQPISTIATTAKLTPQQQERLKGRDRYSDQAVQLYQSGKYDESIAADQKTLAIEREVLGNDHPDTISSLRYLANLYEVQGDFPAARKLREEVVATRTRLFGNDHWQVTNAQLDLAAVDTWTRLKPEDRQAVLVHSDALMRKVQRLSSAGDPKAALPLAKEMLEIRTRVLGPKDRLTGIAAGWMGIVYYQLGQFADAEPFYSQAVDISKEVFGQNHPTYAASIDNMAELYYQMGDYAKSEPLRRQALEIRKQVLGERSADYARTLLGLAGLYGTKGDYAKAEPLYRQASEIWKEVLGEKDPEYARSLNGLGLTYREMGEFNKAEPLYKQSLEIEKEVLGEKHPDYAKSLNGLAALYWEMGDYDKAEPLNLQASEILKQSLGDKNPDYADSQNNLAVLYMDMGDYAKAEPISKQVLEITKQVLGEKHAASASCMSNLAMLYQYMGDYAKAEPLYKKALEIQKEVLGDTNPGYATSLNNLAVLYENMADYPKAESLHKQALEITRQTLGEKHPAYAHSLNNLAQLYLAMGQYARAEPLSRQALDIEKEALGEQHPEYASDLNNLALLYNMMGQYAKAEPLYTKALEIDGQVLGEKHPEYANNLNNLAALYKSMGDYAKAEPLFRQAIQLRKEALGDEHPLYARSLNTLANLLENKGDYAQAAPLYRQALQISRDSLDLSAAVQSERQQLRMSEDVRDYLDDYLSIADGAKTPAEDVYADVLLWKGSVSARQQAIRQMRRAMEGQAQPEVARQYEELTDATRKLANLYQQIPKPEQQEEHRRKLAALSERIEQLEQSLAGASQEFRQQLDQRHRTPADIRRALPPDAALVDLLEYDQYIPPEKSGKERTWLRRLVAFVVRTDQPIERIELGPVEPIAGAIAAWRKNYGQGGGSEMEGPGQQLRRLVWEKIEPSLNGTKTVLLSPDGATAKFPWPALPGKAPGSFLIEDTAIAIVPIPRMLPELLAAPQPADPSSTKPDTAPSLLLVGDVNFGADPGASALAVDDRGAAVGDQRPEWPALPGTAAEVAAIKATFESRFKQAMPAELTQDRATKSAVLRQLANCRYVHFSTHGFFAPSTVRSALGTASGRDRSPGSDLSSSRQEAAGFNPGLLSGLVLAGANRPPQDGKDDGILTALEVAGLDLSHVELATLSACETGLGESAGGEGLLGLQRAFQTAGAKTTVASLWKVPDRATQTLMARFYDNLWNKKMTKLESLLEAQRWLIREGPKKPELLRGRGMELGPEPEEVALQSGRLSPRYWAAFELSGDWR